MKIVADENIPLLSCFFGDMGNVLAKPGREITPEDVHDADAIVVRSVTEVGPDLLQGSRVKFVGSCTIGTDHVDQAYLEEQGIRFASAPGSNANAVVEYLISCLSILSESHNLDLDRQRIGIIGCGNVGGLLRDRLQKMGVTCLAVDPFLDQDEHQLVALDEVLDCDVISLHVPLTESGEHPTYHLFDEKLLSRLSNHQVLINTSRGAVIDNAALRKRLHADPQFPVILDVWETEPDIDPELARRVFLGTPHIAGYSLDGKVAGTEMIYRALCEFLGLPARYKAGQFLEEPPLSKMTFTSMADPDWCMHTAIRACFDVRHDDSLLRSKLELPKTERSQAFDDFRKHYRCRREFHSVKVQLKKVDSELHKKFKALGFKVKT